jgi:sugar/nucleoside kinase (ribokinase family)
MPDEPRSPEVVVLGELNPDIVVTAVPQLSFGQREDLVGATTMTVGSSVAITACGIARLGTRVALVGVVGDDAFGAFMLSRLGERGVATDLVRTVEGGRTGSSVILVSADDAGDRQILTDLGVMADLRAGDLPLDRLEGVGHLHIGSWFLHTGAVGDLPRLLEQARRRGLSTSVDPNDDPARTWTAHLPEALRHVDVFFCNENEAQGVAIGSGAAGPRSRHLAARHIMTELAPGGVVVLKCGAEGAYAHTNDAVVHVQAPVTEVVDTVGAGDTLAAGFLHARLGGADVGAALRLGVAAGSLSTQGSGGVAAQPGSPEAKALAGTLAVTRHDPAAFLTDDLGGR